MKINAVTIAKTPVYNYRKNNSNNINTPKYNSPTIRLNNAQKQSFGEFLSLLVAVALDIIIGYATISEIQDTYGTGVDSTGAQNDCKSIGQLLQEEIQYYAKSLNVSEEEAEKYIDNFLSVAMIKPTKTGNEKGINAIMGYGKEKYNLAMEFLAPIINAQKYHNKNGRKIIPNGLLLYGPGGSGKTYIAEHLCEHLKEFGVNIKELELGDDHEENCKNIRKAFLDAKKLYEETGDYTVIRFPQDIDTKFTDRFASSKYVEETTTFMYYAENSAQKGAVWILTANNPREIDQAVLRRATIKMPIGNMQDFQIGSMLKYETMSIDGADRAQNIDYQKVVDHIRQIKQDFTPDEYKNIVHKAKALGEITSDSLIKATDEYLSLGLQTYDERMKAKFQSDQEYISSFDNEE